MGIGRAGRWRSDSGDPQGAYRGPAVLAGQACRRGDAVMWETLDALINSYLTYGQVVDLLWLIILMLLIALAIGVGKERR